jgi:hypothetical protein
MGRAGIHPDFRRGEFALEKRILMSMLMAGALIGPVTGAAAQSPRPAAAPAAQAASESDRIRLLNKRRARKGAAYAATLRREAAEARAAALAQAQAEREYKAMLPYLLENQRQMLDRQSALEANMVQAERNAVLLRGMTGVTYGTPSPPPRVVNLPGAPLANP